MDFHKNEKGEFQQKNFEISREGHLTLMEEFYFFLTGQFRNGFALPVTSQRNNINWAINDIRIQFINNYDY